MQLTLIKTKKKTKQKQKQKTKIKQTSNKRRQKYHILLFGKQPSFSKTFLGITFIHSIKLLSLVIKIVTKKLNAEIEVSNNFLFDFFFI